MANHRHPPSTRRPAAAGRRSGIQSTAPQAAAHGAPGPSTRAAPPLRSAPAQGAGAAAPPLSERELEELQALLDVVPAPLEPLDVVMLDGYLCGVLVQPRPVPRARWRAHVTDVDGRALPPGFDATRLQALVERRHDALDRAIAGRQWFDPWVFELDDVPGAAGDPGAAVYPWVAGFATALELFPALMALPAQRLAEPLALLYRHLDADDLEDADDLFAEIDSLEPVADLAEAVEGVVRATLLLADVGRPAGRPVR